MSEGTAKHMKIIILKRNLTSGVIDDEVFLYYIDSTEIHIFFRTT